MTSRRQPPITLEAVAEWRRREADAEPPPGPDNGNGSHPDNGKPRNGFHVTAHAAALRPPETAANGFAGSQQAGLAAMIRIAATSAPPQPPPIVRPRTPEPEPPAAPPDPGAAAPAPTVPGTAEPAAGGPGHAVPAVITVTPDHAAVTGRPEGRRRGAARNRSGFVSAPTLSLLVILTVQAVLSLRLVWSNTAFTDEALYLWAGHLEWTHWVHGTPIPPFPTYFSGAPVIYPPLGAVADTFGGLAGARILSLCFMLGATWLLWATASRLYGRRAGFFAAGLWAFLGPTLKLGAFATFDAMSLFLMALAAWFAVRATEGRDFTRWIVASAVALSLANVATYSSVIFGPVVVAIALLAGKEQSAKLSKMRAAALAAYVISVLILLAYAGRGFYWTGVSQTVLSRLNGTTPASEVFSEAAWWTAPVAVVAIVGLLVCAATERSRRQRVLLAVLAGALLLVPLAQARVHTVTSLDKHADFGAWFAAIAAGYAASVLSRVRIPALARAGVTAVGAMALAIPVATGSVQAWSLFGWPDSGPFIAAFRPLAEHSTGPLLVESPSPVRYYLGPEVAWQRWSSTWAVTLASGRVIGKSSGVTSPGVPNDYTRLIKEGFFALVALNSTTTPVLDREITKAMVNSHLYRLVRSVPYNASYHAGHYAIWKRVETAGAP